MADRNVDCGLRNRRTGESASGPEGETETRIQTEYGTTGQQDHGTILNREVQSAWRRA